MGYKKLCKALLLAGVAFGGSALAADATKSMLSNTCAGCHGPEGNSQGPATPGIAGLSKGYFVAAMLAYKYGDEDQIETALGKMPIDSDEVSAYERTSTIMSRIAKGYEDSEILAMAEYFAGKKFIRHQQDTDSSLARKGEKLHEKNCEKCHEDGGRTSEDDVGLLAGQWMPYLENTLNDFRNKDRDMPKKMKSKMKRVDADDVKALVHYYGSQK